MRKGGRELIIKRDKDKGRRSAVEWPPQLLPCSESNTLMRGAGGGGPVRQNHPQAKLQMCVSALNYAQYRVYNVSLRSINVSPLGIVVYVCV